MRTKTFLFCISLLITLSAITHSGSCAVEWTGNIGPAYSVDVSSSCIVDFDKDGTNELLIGTRNGASSTVDILKYNNTSKTWNLIGQINLPGDVSYDTGVHAADMDKDGDLDVVTGIRFWGIYAYENLGSDTWREQRVGLDENYGWFARIVDIDGDGNMDVLHGGDWGGLGIQYGDGNWNFTKGESPFGPDPLPAPQDSFFVNVLRTNDVNNDGKPDILIYGGTRPNAYYPVEYSLYVYLNLGSRQWSSNISPVAPSYPPTYWYFDTGDVNNDNNVDFVISKLTNIGGGLAVFLGDGAGNWNEVSAPTAPNLSSSIRPYPSVSDLNNDGYDDIVTTDQGGPLGCYVFINNKDNTWSEGQSPNTQDDFWLGPAIGDLNNDSLVDMVAYLNFGSLEGVHVWFQKEAIAGSNLILWNKLGSDFEIANSEVGPNLVKNGSPSYDPSKYGNGAHSPNDEADNFTCDSSFLPKDKGCVEFWWKPSFNWDSSDGMNLSFFFNVEDRGPTVPDDTVELSCIYMADENLFYFVYASKKAGEPSCTALMQIIPTPFNAGDIMHLAFVWDINKSIEGQYSLALYQNGVLIGSDTNSLKPQPNWASNIIIAGIGDNYTNINRWEGCKGPMDNLKVWNYPKTDFSDRCSEDGSVPCPASATLKGMIDIDPDTLNIGSEGTWITCYIELPAGYDVNDINQNTVFITKIQDSAITPIPISAEPTQIGDHDSDGTPDLMVKFDRSEVEKVVTVGDKKITVNFSLVDSTKFEGSDVTRVINAPFTKDKMRVLKNKINISKGEKAKIIYKVEENAQVKISIFNMNGELISEYPTAYLMPGEYKKEWDGRTLSGKKVSMGVYIVEIDINGKITRKRVLVKK